MERSRSFSNEDRLVFKLNQLKRAIGTLEQACDISESELERDGTIQRFEYTFELCWKLAYLVVGSHGLEVRSSPKESLREAASLGFIKNLEIWEEMISARNTTSHQYYEAKALEVFNRIKGHYLREILLFAKVMEEQIK